MKNFLTRLLLALFLVAPGMALADVGQPVSSVSGVTIVDCSTTITAGGTAQNIISASPGLHGFILMNIDNTNGSGEPVWISFTGTAAAGASGSYALAAPVATTYAFPGSFASPLGFGPKLAAELHAFLARPKPAEETSSGETAALS